MSEHQDNSQSTSSETQKDTSQDIQQTPSSDTQQTAIDYPSWVSNFQSWLGTDKKGEKHNLSAFFDRSNSWWQAAKELTTDEFTHMSQLLKRDLAMFYHHYKADMEESDFVQAIKESAWQELAELTDKAQIEWQELEQDFRHDGIYHQGEWVGMGVIVCKSCQYKVTYVHPEQLAPCPQCGGNSFLREALAP